MSALKVVIAGPVAAGKTTFVTTLSETETVNTDAAATEDIGKSHTTVAFDFGTLKLDGMELMLFGTPGQDRFDFMWEVVCEGALGLIMLVAGNKPADFGKAKIILEFITSRISVPFVVGVTHQDLPKVWNAEDVADYFQLPHDQVLGLCANQRDQSLEVLIRLLESVPGSGVTA